MYNDSVDSCKGPRITGGLWHVSLRRSWIPPSDAGRPTGRLAPSGNAVLALLAMGGNGSHVCEMALPPNCELAAYACGLCGAHADSSVCA
jgi:hypothetical protein